MLRVCKTCGKTFDIILSEVRKGAGKYCSWDCRTKKLSRICKYCGKEFKVCPTRIKNNGAKFCSRECYYHSRIGIKRESMTDEQKLKLSISHRGLCHTERTKQKISDLTKGKNNPLYGKHHTKDTIEKIRMSLKGRKLSEKTRNRMGEIRKGKKHTEDSRRKMSVTAKEGYKTGKRRLSVTRLNTSIEIAIKNQLDKNDIGYEQQKYLKGIGFVDFFLPKFNIIIECDGDYWHSLEGMQQKDSNRDFASSFLHKFKTLRFWEHEIKESPERCINKIL